MAQNLHLSVGMRKFGQSEMGLALVVAMAWSLAGCTGTGVEMAAIGGDASPNDSQWETDGGRGSTNSGSSGDAGADAERMVDSAVFTDAGVDAERMADAAVFTDAGVGAHAPTWERPFATDSIWKRRIDPNLGRTPVPELRNHTDKAGNAELVHFFDPLSADATVLVNHHGRGEWGNRCATKGAVLRVIRMPKGWHRRIELDRETRNNQVNVLSQDGRMVYTSQASTACNETTLVGGNPPDFAIDGDGLRGARGASKVANGGVLRPPDYRESIEHALEIIANPDHLSQAHGGYRWPALAADKNYDNPDSGGTYRGGTPEMRMGSLLALPQNFNPTREGITDPFMLKLAYALKKYGGYVVDITAWDATFIGVDSSAKAEFDARWNKGQWLELIRHLEVVDVRAP